jgi:hypothetical protein
MESFDMLHINQSILVVLVKPIDGTYRIYVARLRNGGKMSFSKSVHPFRAEPHKFYIYERKLPA